MANPERGEFVLRAGPRQLTLRLTTNAMAEVEDLGGRTFDQILVGLNRGSVRDIRLFLWAALRDRHPDLATEDRRSLHAIGDLIDTIGGLAGLIDQLRAFLVLNDEAPPAPEGRAPDPPAAAADPAGTGGGSSSKRAPPASTPTRSGASRSRSSGANSPPPSSG